MNEADTTFEKLNFVSMFIHAALGIPRLPFAIRTDKSMAAKFGNGTPDVFLVHELRVIYCIFVARVSLTSAPPPFLRQGQAQRRLRFLKQPQTTTFTQCEYVSTVSGESCMVNELSAYAFSTYGTTYVSSVLASTYLDVLLILMFFICLNPLQ